MTPFRSWRRPAPAVLLCLPLTLVLVLAPHAQAQPDLGTALLEAFTPQPDAAGAPMSDAEYDQALGDAAQASTDPAPAAPVTPELIALWADFNHFVRIARPELAAATGSKLLEQATADQLLTLAEGSSEYRDYEQTLLRAGKFQTLADVTAQLNDRLRQARVDRARDGERIAADIDRLTQGLRANTNATRRLAAAGQYAAPHLLKTLADPARKNLHPFVMATMVAIGQPLVYPLAEAVGQLEPTTQVQVAQVLAEIGYPRALPYLRAVIEDPATDATARGKVQTAYDVLAKSLNLPTNTNAPELFLTLAHNLYSAHTRGELIAGFDAATDTGLAWAYDKSAGLVYVAVPRPIYGDVLAMRAARRALNLNPHLDPALSLWLAANVRRGLRLPPGAVDASYPSDLQGPRFYLDMAGPLRQHDVLDRALRDDDAALALQAILALGDTAGMDLLVDRPGAVQPLLTALGYADRRVRFHAAFTLANARADRVFPGSTRVVPVLAEALRQTDKPYALILAQSDDSLNALRAVLRDLGYEPIGAMNLEEATDEINAGPGVDVIVTDLTDDAVRDLLRQTAMHYKLAAVPVVALVSGAEESRLTRDVPGEKRLLSTRAQVSVEAMRPVLEQSAKVYAGAAIDAAEAQQLALRSLELMHALALSPAEVYHVRDALPALIAAMGDPRPDVVRAAAKVLARLDDAPGQQALAQRAITSSDDLALQADLLGSLADAATRFGNQLTPGQLTAVLDLTVNGYGDVALAAARAHGALALPTSNLVGLIAK